MKSTLSLTLLPVILVLFTACTPEIGSDEWCQDMKKMPKADWSANQAADFAKHCIFK